VPTLRSVLVAYGVGRLTLSQIVTALNALTTGQKTNVVNALFGGAVPILQDSGPNAGLITVLYGIVQNVTLLPAESQALKLYAVALFLQDNPTYLVKPAFDATINLLGTTF
jgi:hypothetical protein